MDRWSGWERNLVVRSGCNWGWLITVLQPRLCGLTAEHSPLDMKSPKSERFFPVEHKLPSFLFLTNALLSLPISALLVLPAGNILSPRAPHPLDLKLGVASLESLFLTSFPPPPAHYHHSHHPFLSFTEHVTAYGDLSYCLSLRFWIHNICILAINNEA